MICVCSAMQPAPCDTAAEDQSEGPKRRTLHFKSVVAHLGLSSPPCCTGCSARACRPGTPIGAWLWRTRTCKCSGRPCWGLCRTCSRWAASPSAVVPLPTGMLPMCCKACKASGSIGLGLTHTQGWDAKAPPAWGLVGSTTAAAAASQLTCATAPLSTPCRVPLTSLHAAAACQLMTVTE